MKETALILSMMVLSGIMVLAQDTTPSADVREGAQRARIQEGRKSANLTDGEARALNKQQRHYQKKRTQS